MDSLGDILAAKVVQSNKESNQFIFFNKHIPFILQGVSSCCGLNLINSILISQRLRVFTNRKQGIKIQF